MTFTHSSKDRSMPPSRGKRCLRVRGWQCLPPASIGTIPENVSGVYVLYHGTEVVYIGRARRLRARLLAHYRRFGFDQFKDAETTDAYQRRLLERKLLFRLRPRFNILIPRVFGAEWGYR